MSAEKEVEFEWTPKLSVGEENIDSQHQKLLDYTNKLINDISSSADLRTIRSTIDFLGKYVDEHFSYEEDYMEKIGYPGLSDQQKQHAGFVKFYQEYQQELKTAFSKKESISGKVNELAEKEEKAQETQESKTEPFDMASIKAEINKQLKKGKIEDHEAQILEQRAPVKHVVENAKEEKPKKGAKDYVVMGVPGFDELFENGIPRGNAVLVAGGAGSGKTIMCLQTLNYHASKGEKCFYMSFEESEERLIEHMKEFGWDAEKLIKDGNLKIKRMSPFEITRSVEGMLEMEKGELLIDINPVILPDNFKPDFIVLDSLTAIASAFTGKEDSYRIYIEQLFRFFEKLGATSLLITETKQIPEIFSTTGVEEFLADGVVVLYNIKRGDIRENAIEVLKMRGEKHQKKIVAMQITDKGIVVYPEQEVFGGIGGME